MDGAVKPPIYLIRGQDVKCLMGAFPVVEPEPLLQTRPQLGAVVKGPQIEVLILERPPQPLDKDVVLDPASAVHADVDLVLLSIDR